ncbi:MAG: hypothetical protein Q7S58_16520 [Candidatus Binatus sp.]|nr:hypothetical protein [Candidatus Binatus sp.]MDO8434004.1 hypothetical protein [Candidatus Binatus sp.]
MAAASIDQLIINSPFEEPSSYWSYERESRSFARKEGRRPAGYVTATPGAKSFDDPGIFRELPLVNQIRPRVKAWAAGGYQGTSGITQKLLEHWNDPEQRDGRRFFFCQLEAIETLIWLAEAPAADKVGIEILKVQQERSRALVATVDHSPPTLRRTSECPPTIARTLSAPSHAKPCTDWPTNSRRTPLTPMMTRPSFHVETKALRVSILSVPW